MVLKSGEKAMQSEDFHLFQSMPKYEKENTAPVLFVVSPKQS